MLARDKLPVFYVQFNRDRSEKWYFNVQYRLNGSGGLSNRADKRTGAA